MHTRIHNNYNAKNHFKKGNASNANKINNINQYPSLVQLTMLNSNENAKPNANANGNTNTNNKLD